MTDPRRVQNEEKMSIEDRIRKAKSLDTVDVRNSLAFFQPGDEGVFEIDTVKWVETRGGKLLFTVKLVCIESYKQVKAGQTRDWSCDYLKDAGPPNVKEFLVAASGIQRSDKSGIAQQNWDAIRDGSVEADNVPSAFKGERVVARATGVITKAGAPFTRVDFDAVV
jgi:hypothetical protein